jgi:hypothetical protein
MNVLREHDHKLKNERKNDEEYKKKNEQKNENKHGLDIEYNPEI